MKIFILKKILPQLTVNPFLSSDMVSWYVTSNKTVGGLPLVTKEQFLSRAVGRSENPRILV